VFPLLAVAGLVALLVYQRRERPGRAFGASALFIVGLLATMAAGIYPNVLPAHDGRPFGLTVDNAAAGDDALRIALYWWPVGIALATGYFVYAYRLCVRE